MRREQPSDASSAGTKEPADASLIPSISLPKGGGAIQGIGEKFGANPVTGTASMSVPLATSPSRFAPALSLSYDSGSGNGPFGLGWTLSVPAIARKTEKGLPQYRDADESDVFILSEAEDLVPTLTLQNGGWVREQLTAANYAGVAHTVQRYRPRIEGLFARIEHWINPADRSSFWRTISTDNVASLYGIDADGRISDPADPTRIFKWLLQQSHDDKGNVFVYEYKAEDRDNVADALHEMNRSVGAQRYLKYIRYGNATPYYPDPLDPVSLELPARWYFHVVFDYGEHDLARPQLAADVSWPPRADPFSSYRAGFEIRSYRLCRRVLMFHEFPELGTTPCVVRSTDCTHDATPVATFLRAVRQTAYRRNPADLSYTARSMPPVEFTYSEARIDDTVQLVEGDALENLPYGVDGGKYQWLDLDSEGSPGILTEQGEGWFYKRNVSNLPRDAEGGVRAAFGPVELVASKPSLAASGARQQFVDLAGEGQQCLVQFERPMSGFYARNEVLDWEPFTTFENAANIDFAAPNLRTVDLTGDGFADVLVTDDEAFTWYASLGKQGFSAAEMVRRPVDEDEGPALIFADGTQSIYLADMAGGGLTDLVRIRNGEICYWPNLGYGRFGRKITMSNAPLFDAPEQFDQQRIRLADIDGSGTADIIYLGAREVAIYSNQSGNAWAPARALAQLPAPDNLASVTAIDLLGNGTACLVWSSPLPGDAGRQMRYVDLMGGQKPHLLIGTKNNLGAETRVHYVASTQFYLRDRLAGTPWITRLPFPVHVVDRVEVYDAISRTRFVTRHAYHHGFYDGAEREFRGFGMVEQWDSETFAAFAEDPAVNLDEATALPPVLTRSWFHTGAYLQGARISLLFKDQYYREPGLGQAELDAMLLPDTVLPVGLTAEEEREACRSLKGAVLRQEIYALDGTPQASQPYSVAERNFTIEMLQPQGGQRHAVFFTHAREAIDYHYERALYDINGQQRCDPRVGHSITLAVDAYGNPLRSVAIGYGRRYDSADPLLTAADIALQKRITAIVSDGGFTNATLGLHAYRTPLPAESRSFELLKVAPQATLAGTTSLFRFEEMQSLVQAVSDGAHDIPYEDIDAQGATGAGPYRRLIEQARSVFLRDDLSGALPLGTVEPLALPFESFKLAFTPGLLAVLGAKIAAADAAALLKNEGRYQDVDGDGRLWIPSGRVFLSPDPANPDAAFARAHRYLPQGAQDPFGNISRVEYDSHELFVARTFDALGNSAFAEFDYRVLQAGQVTDPNGNRAAVTFDVFGMVVATAVMGKINEPDGLPKGDLLQGFNADLSDAEIDAFLSDPRGQAAALLGQATSRVVYDVNQYLKAGAPGLAAAIARETHVADLGANQATKHQVRISYSDGFGRVIQVKIPAEVGPVGLGGASINPRWIGSGWTIFNNKGKPVREYEPFFTATHRFEFAVQSGVSPTVFYDPLGRVIATLHPDHTYEKVQFDPWRQQNWDVNDTVTLNPAADLDVAASFGRLDPSEYTPSWYALRTEPANAALAAQRWPDAQQRNAEADAADKAALHANTCGVVHLDALGRTFLTIADNGTEGKHTARVHLDLEDNPREIIDALDRIVMTYDYDMLGARIHQASMEAGERWMLNDAAGKPLRSWDSRGHEFRNQHDALHRPLRTFVRGADAQHPTEEILVSRIEYGEGQPNDVQLNLRAKPFRQFETAGVVVNERYDFKGNLIESSRRLTQVYKAIPDWSASPVLEPLAFSSSNTFDAMNRPTSTTSPDDSVYRAIYNEGNLLERVTVNLRGAQAATPYINNIDYDANGQRERIEYGNGITTQYAHDPLTFRLMALTTTRASDQALLQNLSYAYDPVGNITRIRDGARQDVYFNNQVVTPDNDYRYDAIYRLIHAEGREHIGQLAQPQTTWDDQFRVNQQQPGDEQAMRRYQEDYRYDAVGNFLQLAHAATNGNWSRDYEYGEASLIEGTRLSNRLSGTLVGGSSTETYAHDTHGNMIAMPHLSLMQWDYRDQLSASARQVVSDGTPETTYYVYDGGGQRVRKVTERQNGTRKNERIYLGGLELYREYDGGGTGVTLERETLHVMDDKQRIAVIETRTQGSDGSVAELMRYQFGNHLGSASLELDDAGSVISYEEYFPYGSTSYQAVDQSVKAASKRFRYTGIERDEQTGFNYHSARYYSPWLGRWTSADPDGLKDGSNVYAYVLANPLRLTDPSGLGSDDKILNEIVTWSESLGAMYRGSSASSVKLHDVLRTELPKSLADDPRLITEAVIDKSGKVVRQGMGPQVGGLKGGKGTYQTIDVLVINENVSVADAAKIRAGEISAKNLVTPVDLKLGGATMSEKVAKGLKARLGVRPLLIGQDGRYFISRSNLNKIKSKSGSGESTGDKGKAGESSKSGSNEGDPWDSPPTRGRRGSGGGGAEVKGSATMGVVTSAAIGVAITTAWTLIFEQRLPSPKEIVTSLHPLVSLVQAKDHDDTVIPIVLILAGPLLARGAIAAAPVALPVAAASVGLLYGVPQAAARGMKAHFFSVKSMEDNICAYPGLHCGRRP